MTQPGRHDKRATTGMWRLGDAPRGPARILCLATLAAALAGQIHTPASANVFGDDDRRPLLASDGYDAVGQIACEGSTRLPVGTLIDHPALPADRTHDLIITVAHAFAGSGEVETQCSFLPAGNAKAAVPILRVALGTLDPRRAWHHDWAVAVIGGRLSSSYGALPLRTIGQEDLPALSRAGATYALVGKNGERPRMLISENCRPIPKLHWHHGYFNPAEFNHDCDMIAGWSGGPLVLIERGRRYVVAVNATELNGIIHRHGQPFHPRMFANTAIRMDGDFLAAVERLVTAERPALRAGGAGVTRTADDSKPARLAVLPQGCTGTAASAPTTAPVTGSVVALAADLALVAATDATAVC